MADKTIPQLPRLEEAPAPEDLIIVQDVSDGANGTTKAVKRSDFGGVQSVTGDGVGGTATDVVLTFPTAGEIGAIPATEKGAANGVATLGADGRVLYGQTFLTPFPSWSSLENQHYGMRFARAAQSLTLAVSTVFTNICEVPVDMYVGGLLVNVLTGGGVGCGIELAMYTYGEDNALVITRIGTAGIVDSETNAVKLALFDEPISIPAGYIRLAAIWNGVGSAPVIRGLNGGYSLGTNSLGQLNLTSARSTITGVSIPLPTTLLGASFGNDTIFPSLAYLGTPQ